MVSNGRKSGCSGAFSVSTLCLFVYLFIAFKKPALVRLVQPQGSAAVKQRREKRSRNKLLCSPKGSVGSAGCSAELQVEEERAGK